MSMLGPEEREYVKRVGKKAAIETHMIPVRNRAEKVTYVIFIFRDVTAEQYMQESQQQAVKERDVTKAVVYIKDVEGKYLFANGQFCRIFGKSATEVLGKRDNDFFSPELADGFRENDFLVLRSRAH